MITAEFDYQSPDSIDSILQFLVEDAGDAKVLGGGMTLVPMLNLGLTAPKLVIGLRRVAELSGVREFPDAVVVGAMTRHYTVSQDPLIRRHAPLIGLAAGLIGDVQVRNRGTIGGSLAHADPAANYLPAVIALGAEIEIAGTGGRRMVAAKDFFCDVMTTALEDHELIVAVRIPKSTRRMGCGFRKFTRVTGNFPIVCAAALVEATDGPGKLAIGGVTAVPIVIDVPAGRLDDGCRTAIAGSIRSAVTDPLEDHNGDADYKREMAVVFGLRALADARIDGHAEGAGDAD